MDRTIEEYQKIDAPKSTRGTITDIEVLWRRDSLRKVPPRIKTIYLIRDLAKIPGGPIEGAFLTGSNINVLPTEKRVLFKDAQGVFFRIDESGLPESLEMETISVKKPFTVATLMDLEAAGLTSKWTERLADYGILSPFQQFTQDAVPDLPKFNDTYTMKGTPYLFQVFVKIIYGRSTLATVQLLPGIKPTIIITRVGEPYTQHFLHHVVGIVNRGMIGKWVEDLTK